LEEEAVLGGARLVRGHELAVVYDASTCDVDLRDAVRTSLHDGLSEYVGARDVPCREVEGDHVGGVPDGDLAQVIAATHRSRAPDGGHGQHLGWREGSPYTLRRRESTPHLGEYVESAVSWV
jgi:hypothetical protein